MMVILKTEILNIKLQNATKAKIQNENDKLDRKFTEKYNNMQKGIQKNYNDINKLNRGLISHRTWGTHCKFVRICINSNCDKLQKYILYSYTVMKYDS